MSERVEGLETKSAGGGRGRRCIGVFGIGGNGGGLEGGGGGGGGGGGQVERRGWRGDCKMEGRGWRVVGLGGAFCFVVLSSCGEQPQLSIE